MNTTLSFIVGMVLIVGALGFVFMQKKSSDVVEQQTFSPTNANTNFNAPTTSSDDDSEDENEDDTPQVAPASSGSTEGAASAPGSTGITAAVVAEHNTRASCWSSINGNVYDLTSWIPKHPGGEQAILRLCGIDGSEAFNRKHGGGQSQAAILAGFKIGVLAQ